MTADEIIRLLDELQRRLDGPGRYVFDLAVRQVFLDGVLSLVVGLVLLLAAAFALRWSYRTHTRDVEANKERDWMHTHSSESPFFVAIGGIVAAVLCAMALRAALTNLLNPEWAALTRIIETLKP
jgi:Ca2+/Na+ antiporter